MVNKLFVERNWENFFIKPIILLHLVILFSICSLKFNLESNTKPKCFWLSASWTFVLLKCNFLFFATFIWEAHFYSLLVWIRVEGHLPLEIPFTYFHTVRVGYLNCFCHSLLKIKMCHLQRSYTLRLIHLVNH